MREREKKNEIQPARRLRKREIRMPLVRAFLRDGPLISQRENRVRVRMRIIIRGIILLQKAFVKFYNARHKSSLAQRSARITTLCDDRDIVA